MAAMLRVNRVLSHVDISSNSLGEEGGVVLRDALEENDQVTHAGMIPARGGGIIILSRSRAVSGFVVGLIHVWRERPKMIDVDHIEQLARGGGGRGAARRFRGKRPGECVSVCESESVSVSVSVSV